MLEKSLGKNHAEVAEVLNSMGLVLKKRADYDGAEKLYLRSKFKQPDFILTRSDTAEQSAS